MLTTHHFLCTAQVERPLELDDHSGSALRGTLYEAIWRRFCTNKSAPTCADCQLHLVCPVSAIVAPLREEHPRGRDIPRPYIMLPPLGTARRYAPGETLIFGITLFGSIVQLLPYIIMSVTMLEKDGLGRRLPENKGERGTFRIQHIEAYHPLTTERQRIYQAGKALVKASPLSVCADDVAARANTLPTDRITLDFLTPTRLKSQEKFVSRVEFLSLIQRLTERLQELDTAYGDPATPPIVEDRARLVQLAAEITCEEDSTNWQEVLSHSRRQHGFMHISGFTGKATFTGDLAPFRDILVWGALTHVGKSTVKGNGWYTIE
ncbi:MAG: CRISPR system precrRNA processing endoribonuclease RAMP protein Cas6 [Ktedonobacteraceae bacterium]|nr:CRISPR system precrRNA processing endoribonuclease RAMP protein Cas6 [Ktedonobacteraceae bacterium]